MKRKVDPEAYASTANKVKAYAIIIDAGSSGSRVYVYWWPTNTKGPMRVIQNVPVGGTTDIASQSVSPGISSFAADPSGASSSVKPLLEYAVSFVPQEKLHSTPVLLLATVCHLRTFCVFNCNNNNSNLLTLIFNFLILLIFIYIASIFNFF